MKTWKTWTIAIVALLALLSFPLWHWTFSKDKGLEILVVDKTVPHSNYREHAVLFWTLNHFKTKPPHHQRPWTLSRDYIGYYPERLDRRGKAETRKLTPRVLRGVDLLYLADSYGVYRKDLLQPESPGFSRKIFGGLNRREVKAIERHAGRGGSLVAEFNAFGSPTSKGNARRMETLLGVRWTGWAGKFISNLEDDGEVPVWARQFWERLNQRKWSFNGPGYLLSHEDQRVLVLKQGPDVAPKGLRIRLNPDAHLLTSGLTDGIPYFGWFDIVAPMHKSVVLAAYQFMTTEEGAIKLRTYGIPEYFPTVVAASQVPLRIYLAGDFSDSAHGLGPYNLTGWSWIKGLGHAAGGARDQRPFLWGFYVPLMGNILQLVDRTKEFFPYLCQLVEPEYRPVYPRLCTL